MVFVHDSPATINFPKADGQSKVQGCPLHFLRWLHALHMQFMVLAPLYLKCLSGGDASTHSTASAAHVPLDVVAAVGDGVLVVVAFGIAGDGKTSSSVRQF
jgi:hypothetical protein